jgi:hypothetical protein
MIGPLWVRFVEFGLYAALFAAFCGTVAWRKRRNRFLFFGWLSVPILFLIIDVFIFLLSLKDAK